MRYLMVILTLGLGISTLAMENNGNFPNSESKASVIVASLKNDDKWLKDRLQRAKSSSGFKKRKFRCRYSRCDWTFESSANRDRHENSRHELTNPIYCDFGCGRIFNRKDTMQTHTRREHWLCCGYQFMSKEEIDDHQYENHTQDTKYRKKIKK